jgi:hypothetical protein
MTGINHAVSGAVIAAIIPEAAVAIPLAFLSHFVLDSLPHFGADSLISKNFRRILATDMGLGILFMLSLFIWRPHHWVLLILCAAAAAAPDLMWLPNYIRISHHRPKSQYNLIMKFHQVIQWCERPWGFYVELPWLAIMLTTLLIIEH